MRNTLTLIVYKVLDWLKQESPFWWAIVQVILWSSFGLISTSWVDFRGEEAVLLFIGGLISGVGTRTTKKLSESQIIVDPNKFKQNYQNALQKIEDNKIELKPIETIETVEPTLVINKKFLEEGQWIKEKSKKTQIVLHHSVSSSVDSLFSWWNQDKNRIGTAYSIDKDGTIYNHFPDNEWAYHLYINSPGNKVTKGLKRLSVYRDKESIGIELVNAGGLTLKEGKWYSSYGTVIPNENVVEINYRGYKGFEKYTPQQLASLNFLLESLCEKYDIPYTVPTFDVEDNALKGKPGIYSHTSYRTDKSDCYPDKDLIELLNSLSK